MMKYISEFRDSGRAEKLAAWIGREAGSRTYRLMEVCGTHTVAIFRAGIRSLLPENITLISGPGCPVCVTPPHTLDLIIACARRPDTIIATFGDIIAVPGTSSSLSREKSAGADIRIIYSPLEILDLARAHPAKKVILPAIGFETTIPPAAAAISEARAAGLRNALLIAAGKRIPPALETLAGDPDNRIDGFLCPGHVSTIIGLNPYRTIAHNYRIPCVVAGFEPLDILAAVGRLIEMINARRAGVENLYPRAVRAEGNPRARRLIDEVFRIGDSEWRGLGNIPASGYFLRPQFCRHDAAAVVKPEVIRSQPDPLCRCGDILKGVIEPPDCPAFQKECSPSRPLGPCMVSSEGTCAAWYRYRRNNPKTE